MREELLQRLKTISELVSENELLGLVESLWQACRPSTFTAFHSATRLVATHLRRFGVRSRGFEIPADGKTVLGDWKMPLAWECGAGLLEIIDPFELRHKVLAERKKCPQSVVVWSGPTPPAGITALLVKIGSLEELAAKRAAVAGKLVFITQDPRGWKKALLASGALGVISSWCPEAHHIPEASAWVNSWADDPERGAFHDGDTPFPAMMISSETGVELDVLLERGPVKLRMLVDAHYAPGTLPVICGYMDGPLQEEVLAISNLGHPGANDNASGCAVTLEMLRVLHAATSAGKLAPMRRAVRGLFTHQGNGTAGWAALNPGIVKRFHAAINLDTIGRHRENVDAAFHRVRCPDAGSSVAETLFSILLEIWLPEQLPYAKLREQPFTLVDNIFCDPQLAGPCVTIRGEDRFVRTSADSPESALSGRALHTFATIGAAYVHFLATATGREALWLAQETVGRYGRKMEVTASVYAVELEAAAPEARPALLALAGDHLDYIKAAAEIAVTSAKSFMLHDERAAGHFTLLKYFRHLRRLVDLEMRRLKELADCEPSPLPPLPDEFADIAALRPYRKFTGTPTYASVAQPELPSPAHNDALHAACFWADGEHTFAEIVRRVRYEFSCPLDKSAAEVATMLAPHFRFMAQHGLMLLLKPDEPIPKPPKPAPAPPEEFQEAEKTVSEEQPPQ